MKKYGCFIILFSLFLSCDKEPEKPDEPEHYVCDCIEELNAGIDFDCGCDDPPTGELVWDWNNPLTEEILSSLSTEELTEICLQYPGLNITLFGVNNSEVPFTFDDLIYRRFNGIRELFNRADAAKGLLRHYNCEIQKLSLETIYTITYNVVILEALLGLYSRESEILSTEDYLTVLQSLVNGHEKEITYIGNPNSLYPFITNFFARAHTAIKISPKCIEKFPYEKNNGVFEYSIGILNSETNNIINELSYCLIN